MIKKILVIAGLCLLGGYLVVAAFFFEKKPNEQVCGSFDIVVDNNGGGHFVEAKELEILIDRAGLNPHGKQLKEINTYKIQETLLSNKIVKSAEVYITSGNGVRAIITERIPILRVITSRGENYYIDKEGEAMPFSGLNTAYLPVATGNVKEEFAKHDLHKFALFLQKDEFWNAQIEQIVVQSEKNIILITRVGDHQIEMGSLDNYESKLSRLKTFYEKVLPSTGWNRYSKINLKYDKQVVGTKR